MVVVGDYEVLVTLRSFVLLESRCAECYADDSATYQRGLCCDGDNVESCPSSCDVLLKFFQLEGFHELPQSTVGTPGFQGLLGYNFNATEVHQYNEKGPVGIPYFELINPVTYNGTGKWVRENCCYSIILVHELPLYSVEHSSVYQLMIRTVS